MPNITRLLGAAWRAARGPQLTTDDVNVVHIHVALSDLDVFGHVTNSRYLHYFDLGRVAFLIGAGWARVGLSRRAIYVVGSIDVEFLRPLRWRDQVVLSTRVTCWDERWIHLDQVIERANQPVTRSRSRIQFRSRGRPVPPRELFEARAPNWPKLE